VSGPEILGGGADREHAAAPPRRGRPTTAARRRWAGIAGTVVVGVAAAALAVRSLPEPSATPPPTPAPGFALGPPLRFVADAAVGTKWAYALVASCVGPEDSRQCRYRLLRRALAGGGWTATAVATGPVAGAAGPPRLFRTGERVTVVDQPTMGNVITSPDGGDTATVQGLSSGPPVPAVLQADIVDLALCESCLNRLTVLEPRTGRLRPLARQPMLGSTGGIRSFAESGGALWSVADGGSRLVSAVSVDGGRTWQELPIGGGPGAAEMTVLAPDGRRGAYLLVGRDTRPDVVNEFSELWRVGDPTRPGAAWRQITPSARPRSASGLVVSGGALLIRDDARQLLRLGPDGVLRALPPVRLDGVPAGPDLVVAGPGRLLLGVVNRPDDTGPLRILLSRDGGETWRVEQLPP
jgi:hypothetical protein